MHITAIAIAAFDPAGLMRDLEPDAGVAKGGRAAVTGDAPGGHNFGLRRGNGHLKAFVCVTHLHSRAQAAGKAELSELRQ